MMRLRGSVAVILLLLLIGEKGAAVPGTGRDDEELERIDELFGRAMEENYSPEGRAIMGDSLAACEHALEASPSDYELLWRAARSAMELAESSRIQKSRDWKELCDSLLPAALTRTEAAVAIEPKRVEAYFWQLQVIGLVYDADGIASFVSRGLPAKVRRDIDACKAIDPSYMDYSIMLADAVYYYSLPLLWGRDVTKALALYKEFEAHTGWSFEPYRQYLQAANLLIGTKNPENIARARELLLRILNDPTPRPYYRDLSEKLLATVENALKQ